MVPVAGADMSKVEDTFLDGRDGGERTHRAIDILAPRGTPILSADDGKILRMFEQFVRRHHEYTVDPVQPDRVLLRAHGSLQRRHVPRPRDRPRRHARLVGTTGNAPKDTPHLHFPDHALADGRKYWNGEPIDPFDLLGGVRPHKRDARGAQPLDLASLRSAG